MLQSNAPLILTLKFESSAFETLNDLRKKYFPPERNFLAAHITLFHALPGENQILIEQHLNEISQKTPILNLIFSAPRFLGKGVAIDTIGPELIRLRAELTDQWSAWLTKQDGQKNFRPHVTIQNKVEPNVARELFELLKNEWQPIESTGEGLQLWQYLGGPWKLIKTFDFKSEII